MEKEANEMTKVEEIAGWTKEDRREGKRGGREEERVWFSGEMDQQKCEGKKNQTWG